MMYDTVDTVYDCVRIATGVMSTLKIKPDRMLKGANTTLPLDLLTQCLHCKLVAQC